MAVMKVRQFRVVNVVSAVSAAVWAFAVGPFEIRAATAKRRIRALSTNRMFMSETRFRFIYPILANFA